MRSRIGSLLAMVAMGVAGTALAPPPPPGWNPPLLSHGEFSPDSKLILADFLQTTIWGVGSNQTHTCLYDTATGKKLAEIPGGSYKDCRAMHPDGVHILRVKPMPDWKSRGEEMVLWNWQTGKDVRKFEPATSEVATLAFSPDGKFAFSGHWDNRILMWDVASGKQVRAFDLPHKPHQLSTAHVPSFFIPED